jgi:NIPSNAP
LQRAIERGTQLFALFRRIRRARTADRVTQPLRTQSPCQGEPQMALYEMRTYTLYVGKMAEATKLYQELGFPALQKGGHDKKLIGYFQGDTGMINQLVHLWKFEDDADRRKHWAGVFANKDFVEGFASRFRPLVMSQEVKLLTAAPWGPHP